MATWPQTIHLATKLRSSPLPFSVSRVLTHTQGKTYWHCWMGATLPRERPRLQWSIIVVLSANFHQLIWLDTIYFSPNHPSIALENSLWLWWRKGSLTGSTAPSGRHLIRRRHRLPSTPWRHSLRQWSSHRRQCPRRSLRLLLLFTLLVPRSRKLGIH